MDKIEKDLIFMLGDEMENLPFDYWDDLKEGEDGKKDQERIIFTYSTPEDLDKINLKDYKEFKKKCYEDRINATYNDFIKHYANENELKKYKYRDHKNLIKYYEDFKKFYVNKYGRFKKLVETDEFILNFCDAKEDLKEKMERLRTGYYW